MFAYDFRGLIDPQSLYLNPHPLQKRKLRPRDVICERLQNLANDRAQARTQSL